MIRYHIFNFSYVFPGDVGGQIGLFIGAGVLTYVELFDCFCMVVYTIFYEKIVAKGDGSAKNGTDCKSKDSDSKSDEKDLKSDDKNCKSDGIDDKSDGNNQKSNANHIQSENASCKGDGSSIEGLSDCDDIIENLAKARHRKITEQLSLEETNEGQYYDAGISRTMTTFDKFWFNPNSVRRKIWKCRKTKKRNKEVTL